jgi:hypothetical protein
MSTSKAQTLWLIDYLHYIAWASFNTFHAPCATRMVDGRRRPLFYGIFLAGVYAVVTCAALAYYRQVYVFVVLEFLNFTRFQQLRLQQDH